MSAELLKLCDPQAYYDEFLSEGLYPDGRPINAFTKISFKRGACGGVGSALVRQGGVTVSCAVQADMSLRNDGILVNPKIESCSDISQKEKNAILDVLNDLFSTNKLFDREALLCRGSEESLRLTWILRLQIRILNADGCVVDAVVGAVAAALSDVRLPHVNVAHSIDDESPILKEQITLLNETSPLFLSDYPVAATFVLYQIQSSSNKPDILLLCDPPSNVLNISSVRCCVILGEKGILSLRTHGPLPDPIVVGKMIDAITSRRKEVMLALGL